MSNIYARLRLSQGGFSQHLLLPALVIGIVGGVGAYVIAKSHAQTPLTTYTSFYNNSSVVGIGQNGIYTATDMVGGIGSQTVTGISPGNKLVFNYFSTKVPSFATCYYLRVYNSPKANTQVTSANVQLVGDGNSTVFTLPADANYHQACVKPGSGPQLNYNVMNQSNSAYVLFYQALTDYIQN